MHDAIYYFLNAGVQPVPAVVTLATLVSRQMPWLIDLLLCGVLVFGSARARYLALLALVSLGICAVLSWTIGQLAYMPRPFVLGMGTNLLPHKPNASFPSNHMLFITVMTATAFFGQRQRVFWCLLPLMLAMGWSRIYLGVHFPRDVAGSLVIGFGVAWVLFRVMRPAEERVVSWLSRIPSLCRR